MKNNNRLTESDDLGNWGAKGLTWKELYVGEVITRNIHEKLYGCLAKLKDYEETGLEPEEVEELSQLNTPLAPLEKLLNYGKGYECKNCGNEISDNEQYCHWCGQRLDWSEKR